jgi:hypothetical protein
MLWVKFPTLTFQSKSTCAGVIGTFRQQFQLFGRRWTAAALPKGMSVEALD